MKVWFLSPVTVVATALMSLPVLAQTRPMPLHMSQPVVDKNFYLFSVLARNAASLQAFASDPEIAQVSEERRGAVIAAGRVCKQDVACEVKAYLWTDEEILSVSLALRRLGDGNGELRAVVENQLRPSFTYVLLEKLGSGEMLVHAWEICARGVNNMLAVYGQGMAPRYPAIDSISFDMKSGEAKQRVAALVAADSAPNAPAEAFFLPALRVALTLLELNHRDEAARHEPMEEGTNKMAFAAIGATHWQRYPYTVIVVPGAGPSDPQTALSEMGRKRCAIAAEAYHAGKAPFVLVSGGYVHPAETPFSEAIEMKRALIEEFHLPEAAILVDPHARHTTTNMRNSAREIFRYGIPSDKPALMISDPAQTSYIAGERLADRCLRELGYVPYRIVRKNSDTELVFMPLVESLEQDPIDPLDP